MDTKVEHVIKLLIDKANSFRFICANEKEMNMSSAYAAISMNVLKTINRAIKEKSEVSSISYIIFAE